MPAFLALVAGLNNWIGWLGPVGVMLRFILERDLAFEPENMSQLVPDLQGIRYYGPMKMRITNNSHDYTYKFRFQDSRICITRPVLPGLLGSITRFWRIDERVVEATVLGDPVRDTLADYLLTPLSDVGLLIEWGTQDFPRTGSGVPPHAIAVFRVPMVGRLRKIERAFAKLKVAQS